MAEFNNAIITNAGAMLLAATVSGTAKIKFTKLVIGSGNYGENEKTRESLQERTSLKEPKQDFSFSSIAMPTDTCVKLTALISNEELVEGYYVNEVGIYAIDELNVKPEPILYSIAIANVADYLPPFNGLTPSTITQEYFTTVNNALDVTIQTPAGVVALAEDLRETNKILSYALAENDRIYEGRDLTSVFATEIATYTDVWTWIKARIKAHNFAGIHVADYIPITLNEEIVKMQVAGIDCYYGTTDKRVGHHIDFISKDCYSNLIKWNNTATNNGSATNIFPYTASNLYTFLNTTLYGYLPAEVKKVIGSKRTLVEARYNSAGILSDGTAHEWQDIGVLWLPSEYEVFGSIICGTKVWSEGQAMQYPLFANSYLNRIKGVGDGGTAGSWWLSTVVGASSSKCVSVSHVGFSSNFHNADNELGVPICFRIDET